MCLGRLLFYQTECAQLSQHVCKQCKQFMSCSSGPSRLSQNLTNPPPAVPLHACLTCTAFFFSREILSWFVVMWSLLTLSVGHLPACFDLFPSLYYPCCRGTFAHLLKAALLACLRCVLLIISPLTHHQLVSYYTETLAPFMLHMIHMIPTNKQTNKQNAYLTNPAYMNNRSQYILISQAD